MSKMIEAFTDLIELAKRERIPPLRITPEEYASLNPIEKFFVQVRLNIDEEVAKEIAAEEGRPLREEETTSGRLRFLEPKKEEEVIVATFPDGTKRTFFSARQAGEYFGVTGNVIGTRIRFGKKLNGATLKKELVLK